MCLAPRRWSYKNIRCYQKTKTKYHRQQANPEQNPAYCWFLSQAAFHGGPTKFSIAKLACWMGTPTINFLWNSQCSFIAKRCVWEDALYTFKMHKEKKQFLRGNALKSIGRGYTKCVQFAWGFFIHSFIKSSRSGTSDRAPANRTNSDHSIHPSQYYLGF